MSSDIVQLAINSSGAALVTAIFIWYLLQHGKEDAKREQRQEIIIQKYLAESNKTHKELSRNLEKFSLTITEQEKTIHELKEVIRRLYDELVNKTKRAEAAKAA